MREEVEQKGTRAMMIDSLNGSRLSLTIADSVIAHGLPQRDGYEVARRLRLEAVDARLVALTGYGREADVRRSREAGIDHHLVKPVAPEQLRTLIERG